MGVEILGARALSDAEKAVRINPRCLASNGHLLPFSQQYGIYELARKAMGPQGDTGLSHFVLTLNGVVFGVEALAGKPLVITKGTVDHIVKKHDAPYEVFDRLCDELVENVLAFQEETEPEKYVFVLGDATSEGSHYITVIRASLSMDTVMVDQVRTLFAKRDLDGLVQASIDRGLPFFVNERTGSWLRSQGNRDRDGLPALSLRSRRYLSGIYCSKFGVEDSLSVCASDLGHARLVNANPTGIDDLTCADAEPISACGPYGAIDEATEGRWEWLGSIYAGPREAQVVPSEWREDARQACHDIGEPAITPDSGQER